MIRSVYRGGLMAAALLGLTVWSGPSAAQSVMQQCGQQYQAAKAANTLNGATWNQYRVECAARLKAQPAAQTSPAPAPAPAAATAPAPAPVAPKPMPAPTTAAAPAPAPAPASTTATAPAAKPAGTKPVSAGSAAFYARERQCGTEWKANKVALKTQTPGITWPKYLSQCNTRLKAAGQ